MGDAFTVGQEVQPAELSMLRDDNGVMTVAGFGSLLSERSSRRTFPDLRNFRIGRVTGFRRVFAHVAPIFFETGIARMETMEISSLSCEPWDEGSIVVSLFEVDCSNQADLDAFVEREHEFRFVVVQPQPLAPSAEPPRLAVLCARYSDEEYKAARCPPGEFHRRYGRHGIDRVWRDDVFPCRTYLRHCVLAAERLGQEAYDSFMDSTFLADRETTVREWLRRNPDIMAEEPPPELAERYGG
ncbi:unnamed protein product [Pedinophyceae sp. YPF-701]|nr:unnamed protein product [Pedinophyceae sp. YPF-701]